MSKDKIPAYQVPITLLPTDLQKDAIDMGYEDTVRIAYQDGTLVLLFPDWLDHGSRRILIEQSATDCDEGAIDLIEHRMDEQEALLDWRPLKELTDLLNNQSGKEIEISDDMAEFLDSQKRNGETYDAVICRLLNIPKE